MSLVIIGVVVFCLTAALDVVQAYWLRAYNARQAGRAAALSVLEYAIGCFSFFAFVEHSWWLVLPEVAGLVVGSLFAIRRIARSDVSTGESTSLAQGAQAARPCA